jgi:hypothetical protein
MLPATVAGGDFTFVNLVPFTAKKKGMLGSYRMGSWPAEQRALSGPYGNPEGFIQVTPDNQHTGISEHFRLRDFLTKDQGSVWPKYLVLREGLIDKLELVIGALNKSGVNVARMSVMSGSGRPSTTNVASARAAGLRTAGISMVMPRTSSSTTTATAAWMISTGTAV